MPTQNRSWLALITFCATTALVAALALAILITSATVAFAVAQSFSSQRNAATPETGTPADGSLQKADPEETFTGVITDVRCGAKHLRNSDKSPAECVRTCVRKGSGYTVVNGNHQYLLEGDPEYLDKFAGQRASIAGTLNGNKIQVTSISPQ